MSKIRHILARAAIVAVVALLAAIALNFYLGSESARAHGWPLAVSECQVNTCNATHHGPGDTGQGSQEHSHCSPGSCGHAFMTAPETVQNPSLFERHLADRVHIELTGMSAPPPQPPPKHTIL